MENSRPASDDQYTVRGYGHVREGLKGGKAIDAGLLSAIIRSSLADFGRRPDAAPSVPDPGEGDRTTACTWQGKPAESAEGCTHGLQDPWPRRHPGGRGQWNSVPKALPAGKGEYLQERSGNAAGLRWGWHPAMTGNPVPGCRRKPRRRSARVRCSPCTGNFPEV